MVVALGVAVATMDRWLMAALHPGAFDPEATPPAPDYGTAAAWAALPELDDGADVALDELPAIATDDAVADVFYLHPTTWLGRAWNGPWDDPTVAEATHRGGTLIQASAFNGCCRVYAPRYRQANGNAYVFPDADGARARDVAFADVDAAFDEFLARIGDRPFLVVGHSQGAVLAGRLLRDRIAGTALQARMVVAYLPGAPLSAVDVGDIPVCETPTQTGCLAAWNARGPAYEPNDLEFDARNPDTMTGRVCVNPITWSAAEPSAARGRNAGAVFFDTDAPAIVSEFADASCEEGVLVVREMGDPQRDFMSKLLLWTTGPENYHPIEVQLYYVDLRRNALARVEAFGRATPQGS